MKVFTRFLNFFERASLSVPTDRCYAHDLELLEDKGILRFTTATSLNGVGRFISWFRWGFLAVSIGFSVWAYYDIGASGDGLAVVLSWFFALAALGIGFGGAFIACPVMLMAFRRIESMEAKQDAKLPSFDLLHKMVNLPDSNAAHPFDCFLGLRSLEESPQWRKLVLVTQDNNVVFLVNCPAKRTSQILERVSGATSIKILSGSLPPPPPIAVRSRQ